MELLTQTTAVEAMRRARDFLQDFFGPVADDGIGGWSDEDAYAALAALCAALAEA